MVRDMLIFGGFNLGDEAVLLESPAEDRRRLDKAVCALIIEINRDIRTRGHLEHAETQLGESSRQDCHGGRYAGVLTDGAIWRLYSERRRET
jgi:hypothetical protein